MDKITQITLAWDLRRQGIPKTRIAQRLGRSRETIILWLQGIERHGHAAFLQQHQKANKQLSTPIRWRGEVTRHSLK